MAGELRGQEQSLLERFARALARIVYDERPEALSRPITVAELYQDLAPYRRMRELAGLELHADYEHALIRFLSGEGGFAQLDPDTAADELGIEAESSDPDLSLYRKFAACEVRLSLARPAADGFAADPVPRPVPPPAPPISELAARAIEEARAAEPVPDPPRPTAPAPTPTRATVAETMRALASDSAPPAAQTSARSNPGSGGGRGAMPRQGAPRCAFCGQGLPADRDVRFCPHCGVDQTAQACGSCGADLEAGWRFCVACGAAADA